MTNLNKAFLPRPEDIKEHWELIDATGKTVGRLATEIANKVRGKNLIISTPNVKTGAKVVVINAEKVVFTGNKIDTKEYWEFTGYIGNRKEFTPKDLIKKGKAEYILEHAVKGMLRNCKMDKQLFKSHVYIYKGTEHPHKAQIK
jgi:large subunit ribosomal protein L13